MSDHKFSPETVSDPPFPTEDGVNDESEEETPPQKPPPLRQVLAEMEGASSEEKNEILARLLEDSERLKEEADRFLSDDGSVLADLSRIRSQRGMSRLADDIKRKLRRKAAELRREKNRPQQTAGRTLISEATSEVPSGAPLVQPQGFAVSDQGVTRLTTTENGQTQHVLSDLPVLITRLLDSVDPDGTRSVEVSFREHPESDWTAIVVPKASLSDGRTIIAILGNTALNITSNNARFFIEFFEKMLVANRTILPVTRCTQKMGWHRQKNRHLCVLSQQTIGGDEPLIVFKPQQGGEEYAKIVSTAGSLAGWKAAVALCTPFPVVMLALYASIASVLVYALKRDNFAVHWGGVTSRGKTTALKLGASCWGRPDEGGGGYLRTWDSSTTAIERVAAILQNLPIILDDTKRARFPTMVPDITYNHSSGRGRERGTVTGLQATSAWCSVLLSSGESGLTDCSEDGGTRARSVDLYTPPFGSADAETGRLVERLKRLLAEHYGHAGPMVITHMLNPETDWALMRENCAEYERFWQETAGDNAVLGRLAGHMAVLETAGRLVHDLFGFSGKARENLLAVWSKMNENGVSEDPPTRALRQVYDWAASNQDDFLGREGEHPPHQGWAGSWSGEAEWTEIDFYPDRLKAVLRELGHREPGGITKSWKQRGWLRCEGKRLTAKVQMQNKVRVRLVCILRSALCENGITDEIDLP